MGKSMTLNSWSAERDDEIRQLLRRRFKIAAIGVAAPLLVLTGIAILFLNANRAGNAFAEALFELETAIWSVETEISHAAVLEEVRVEQLASARQDFIRLLKVYGALRAADPDGVDDDDDEQGSAETFNQLAAIYQQFGVEPNAELARFDFDGGEMPEVLEEIWEAYESEGGKQVTEGQTSLETGVAWFILASAPIFFQEDPSAQDLAAGVRATFQVSNHVIGDQMKELSAALVEYSETTAAAPVYVVFAISLLVLAAMLIVRFRVLKPTESEISAIQSEMSAARIRAQESDRSKSEFLANMSHEIRTPMNGVIAMSELLVGTKLDEQQKVFAETIHESGRALLNLINDILDFSKIDAGKLELDIQPLDVRRIAQDPGRLLSMVANHKGVELLARVGHDLPQQVMGDEGRLKQVVINLANNAIKFTDHGQVLVDISRIEAGDPYAASADGPSLKVAVQDTGCGIPEADVARVFEMFTQVDGSYAREHEGAGLGLSICKGLVELMGGRIGVESELHEGSTFWFSIPLVSAEAAEPDAFAVARLEDTRVLVVDDNESNRLILHELLDAWRMDESAVSSGREALRKLTTAANRNRPYDLVILDHHMPGMSGGQTLQAIRETAEIADIPVILLSSMDLAPSELDSGGHMPEACLSKPVASSELFDRIAAVLSDANGKQAESAKAAAERMAATRAAASDPVDGAFLVLIVDDNIINRRVAGAVLNSLDTQFREAVDGVEAATTYADLRPDVVLMDVSMPGMDGYEATAEIRRIEAELDLPRAYIVGLTAHAMPGDREKCLEADMDDYLAKPLSGEALEDICRARKAVRDGAKSAA